MPISRHAYTLLVANCVIIAGLTLTYAFWRAGKPGKLTRRKAVRRRRPAEMTTIVEPEAQGSGSGSGSDSGSDSDPHSHSNNALPDEHGHPADSEIIQNTPHTTALHDSEEEIDSQATSVHSSDLNTEDLDPELEATRQKDMQSLIYQIARDDAINRSVFHRGVTCSNCGMRPIRGVRFNCLQCLHYNLCTACEELQPHDYTHIFAKLRASAPFFSFINPPIQGFPGVENQKKEDRPPLSPGFHQSMALDIGQIEGMYYQFCCYSSTTGAQRAQMMSYEQFLKAFPVQPPKSMVAGNYYYCRVFSLYADFNPDGISFENAVRVSMHAHTTGMTEEKIQLAFKAFDDNRDGRISRQDVIRFLTAHFEVQRQMAGDMYAGWTPYGWENAANGSLPVNAYFASPISRYSDKSIFDVDFGSRQEELAKQESSALADVPVRKTDQLNENDLHVLRKHLGAAGRKVPELLSAGEVENGLREIRRDETGLYPETYLEYEMPVPSVSTGTEVVSDLVRLGISDKLDCLFYPWELRAVICRRTLPLRRRLEKEISRYIVENHKSLIEDEITMEHRLLSSWPPENSPWERLELALEALDESAAMGQKMSDSQMRQLALDTMFEQKMFPDRTAERAVPQIGLAQFRRSLARNANLDFVVAWVDRIGLF